MTTKIDIAEGGILAIAQSASDAQQIYTTSNVIAATSTDDPAITALLATVTTKKRGLFSRSLATVVDDILRNLTNQSVGIIAVAGKEGNAYRSTTIDLATGRTTHEEQPCSAGAKHLPLDSLIELCNDPSAKLQIGLCRGTTVKALYHPDIKLIAPPSNYASILGGLLSGPKKGLNAQAYALFENAIAQKNWNETRNILENFVNAGYTPGDIAEWWVKSKIGKVSVLISPRAPSPTDRKQQLVTTIHSRRDTRDVIVQLDPTPQQGEDTEHCINRLADERKEIAQELERKLCWPATTFDHVHYVTLRPERREAPLVCRALATRSAGTIGISSHLASKIIRPTLANPIYHPELLFDERWRRGRAVTGEGLAWHLDEAHTNALAAHVQTRGNGVKVLVIDTGVDFTHPVLQYVYDQDHLGKNFIHPGKKPMDDNGHGTHVSGLIGGIKGSMPIGAATHCQLIAAKVLDKDGYGSVVDSAKALDYAITEGIHLVNMSFGSPSYSQLEADAVQAVLDAGIHLFAAAGNEERGPSYPAAYGGVCSVAAVDHKNDHAWFSNIDPTVCISAPGVDIFSCVPNGLYELMSGTSMATPITTGCAALAISVAPHITIDELLNVLQSTAMKLGKSSDPERDAKYGAGEIRAYEAVASLVGETAMARQQPHAVVAQRMYARLRAYARGGVA